MHIVRHLEYYSGSKEEKLPDFRPDFPYIATQVELDHYKGFFVPWHWHKALELFYMESGELRYHTPGGTLVFPAGSGGLVNSNVLHMTEVLSRTGPNIQKIHFFDPVLISGSYDSLIEQKYVTPVTSIGHACGLGSSSYFGKTFRSHLGCTPLEYRRRWQDNDKN